MQNHHYCCLELVIGVANSSLELSKMVRIVWDCLESFGVVKSRYLELPGYVWSNLELS